MKRYIFVIAAALLVYLIVMILMLSGYYPRGQGEKEQNESAPAIPETEETEAVTIFEPIEIDTSEQAPKTDPEAEETEETTAQNYTDEDLLYLAKIVQNEAGSDFCSDEHQRAVASVVLNRVADPRFPDTIYGVISQGWNGECALQYAVGGWERFNALEPSERALENARYVLEHGSTVGSAIWQAEFIQGEIVAQYAYPEIYSTVTYICE